MWVVQLEGDPSDLAALSQSLTGSRINVSHDGQEYVLGSDQFSSSDEANVVCEKAKELVIVLSGASRLALDLVQSITVGAVYRLRDDGKRGGIFVFPGTAVLRIRSFSPTVRLTHLDGTVEEFHRADPVKRWLALKNDAIDNVFRVLAAGTPDWINLYRIFEIVVSNVGGLDVIDANGWATKSSMKLFKHTANSPSVLGLEARHGAETTQPPKHPMTLLEARALINSIVHAWLGSMVAASGL